MAKEFYWNVSSQGIPHRVKMAKNRIFIDDAEGVKLKTFPRQTVKGIGEYSITIGADTFLLYVDPYAAPTLTINGVDVNTGEVYTPKRPPVWTWLFYALFIADFVVLVGGAVGGAMNAGGAALVATIAKKKDLSTPVKFLCCLGTWIVFTIIEVVLAIAIAGTFYGLGLIK